MPTLTPQQITQYYASEAKKPNPLSPLDWLAQQTGTPVQPVAPAQPVASVSPISTPVAPQALTTAQLIAQTQAIIAQTQAQGNTPFAGSSFDVNATIPTTPITPTYTPTTSTTPTSTTPTTTPAPPTQNYDALKAQKYQEAGLADIKARMDALDAKILASKNKLYGEEAEVMDNPWLSNASRVGRVKTLYDMANKEIGNLLDERKLLADDYTTGISEIDKSVEAQLNIEAQTRELAQQQLQYQTPEQELAAYTAKLQAQAQVEQQYATPEKPATTADITEYEYAKTQGYTGTFDQWLAQKKTTGGTSGAGETTLSASDTAIRNWILKNKQANPDIPYYDLWGQLSDEMKKQGLNPSNYDKIFWEILHPEGEAGYEKYVKGATGGTTIKNPFE
jgi:hypothetical protein